MTCAIEKDGPRDSCGLSSVDTVPRYLEESFLGPSLYHTECRYRHRQIETDVNDLRRWNLAIHPCPHAAALTRAIKSSTFRTAQTTMSAHTPNELRSNCPLRNYTAEARTGLRIEARKIPRRAHSRRARRRETIR